MRFLYSKNAQKQFKKLDSAIQKRVKDYTQRIAKARKSTKKR